MQLEEKMLRTILIGVVCWLSIFACACAPAVPSTASASEATSQTARLESAVEIQVSDQAGTLVGTGSGFFIEPPSYQGDSTQMARVATCLHVIAPAHQLAVKTSDGAVHKARFITQVGFDADLSVFSVALPASNVTAVKMAEHEANRNEAVTIRHSPWGKGILTSRGSILGRTMFTGLVVTPLASVYYAGSLLKLSTPLYPGSSGGGAFNQEGKLIGIAAQISADAYLLIPAARLNNLSNLPQPLPPAEFSAQFLGMQREWLLNQMNQAMPPPVGPPEQ